MNYIQRFIVHGESGFFFYFMDNFTLNLRDKIFLNCMHIRYYIPIGNNKALISDDILMCKTSFIVN